MKQTNFITIAKNWPCPFVSLQTRYEDAPQPLMLIAETAPITFGELFYLYIGMYASTRTKRPTDTIANFDRYFGNFKERPVAEIKRLEVQKWVNDLAEQKGKHTANRNYDILRAVFNWGIKLEIIAQRNPCLGVDVFKLKARERFVQPGAEYKRLSAAINAERDSTMRDFFWMCLYTGARKSNIKTMRFDQISFEYSLWKITGDASKNGESINIPLSPEAIVLLNQRRERVSGDWVFPGRFGGHIVSVGSAWRRIRNRAELPDIRIHDLRRTLGSHMAINGVSPIIIGKALGHKSMKSTAVYARLNDAPVREAMARAIQGFEASQ